MDADPLEAVLSRIAGALTGHDDIILSRLPKIESAQLDLRKDISHLRLAIESTQRVDGDTDTNAVSTDASRVCFITDKSSSLANDSAEADTCSTYGISKRDLAPIQQKLGNAFTSANDIAMGSSLQEIKAVLCRLQKDRDDGIVNSMELDERIKSMKDLLFEMQLKLASTATMDQLQTLKVSLAAQYGRIEHHIQESSATIHTEAVGRINQHLSDVKAWFAELETAMKQRQVKLEQRVASCATEYDIAAFRERIDTDVASLARKTSFLDDTARAQGGTMVLLQQKNAIVMLHQRCIRRTQRVLKVGLYHWKQFIQRQLQYESGKESQTRLLRKVLTNIISRRKRQSFGKWVRYLDWHRKMEHRKLKATTMICERLGSHFSASMSTAFNQWRRLTLLDRMERANGVFAIDEDSKSTPLHDMLKLMGSFKGDVQGAIHVLAQEVTNVKSLCIPSLRQEWCAENQKSMSSVRTNINVAIQGVQETVDVFRESIDKRVDSCGNDLRTVHSKLNELSNLFQSSKINLESVDKSHAQRIDAILAQERNMEQSLLAVEEQALNSSLQITSLTEQQTESNASIQHLREAMATNEKRHEEERESFQHALDHFGDELLKTKVSLGHTRVRCDFLEKELAEVKLELVHFQDACQAENDRVQSHIRHPGILKPSLNRIVNVGHAYEALCKEKNYVPGINITVTLRTTTTMKMKRNEEKVKKSEDVEIPSEIAAFAHDYAAWIAYHSDHESLLRLIAGTNPESVIYAEDDNISRRKELCVDLKTELGTLLERASATVLETSNKHESTSSTNTSTRGMGLRWEARAIFLARIVDAVNAALSKHDQILLPASTRIGRVGTLSSANVNVCMACDRPLRTKTNRSE